MAKKSMIEREKKRSKLHDKYKLKRNQLIKNYQKADTFSLKLEISLIIYLFSHYLD